MRNILGYYKCDDNDEEEEGEGRRRRTTTMTMSIYTKPFLHLPKFCSILNFSIFKTDLRGTIASKTNNKGPYCRDIVEILCVGGSSV